MYKSNSSIVPTANVIIPSLRVATRTEFCRPNGTADCRNYDTFSALARHKQAAYWEKTFLYYLQLLKVNNVSFTIFDQFQLQNFTVGNDANTLLGSIATENTDVVSYPVTYSYERHQIVRYSLPFIDLRACFFAEKQNQDDSDFMGNDFFFIAPFSKNVWLLIGCLLILSICVYALIEFKISWFKRTELVRQAFYFSFTMAYATILTVYVAHMRAMFSQSATVEF